MTLNEMPYDTAGMILNMIAYGCFDRNGFSYDLLLCRTRELIPAGEQLAEFKPTTDYSTFTSDDIDHAAFCAASRLCV